MLVIQVSVDIEVAPESQGFSGALCDTYQGSCDPAINCTLANPTCNNEYKCVCAPGVFHFTCNRYQAILDRIVH